MVKEYRVGTDCGAPSILCNGVPIGLDEVADILNTTYTKQQNAIAVSDRYPVYFINVDGEGSRYNCIILCTKSDVFDRIVEKPCLKTLRKNITYPVSYFYALVAYWATRPSMQPKNVA